MLVQIQIKQPDCVSNDELAPINLFLKHEIDIHEIENIILKIGADKQKIITKIQQKLENKEIEGKLDPYGLNQGTYKIFVSEDYNAQNYYIQIQKEVVFAIGEFYTFEYRTQKIMEINTYSHEIKEIHHYD